MADFPKRGSKGNKKQGKVSNFKHFKGFVCAVVKNLATATLERASL